MCKPVVIVAGVANRKVEVGLSGVPRGTNKHTINMVVFYCDLKVYSSVMHDCGDTGGD